MRTAASRIFLCVAGLTFVGSLLAGHSQGRQPATQKASKKSDWPQFRGPLLNGISPETGIRKDWPAHPPRVLWTVPLTDDGYAGPSVAGGLVYIVDHTDENDVVRALDLETGAERWRYQYPESRRTIYASARAPPTLADGRVSPSAARASSTASMHETAR